MKLGIVSILIAVAFVVPGRADDAVSLDDARIKALAGADAKAQRAAIQQLVEVGAAAVPALVAVVDRNGPADVKPAQQALLGIASHALAAVEDLCRRHEISALDDFLESCRAFAQEKTLNIAVLGRFKAGKSSFLDLLDSERIYLNARLSQVQFHAEALKAYGDISWATGLDLGNTKTESQL